MNNLPTSSCPPALLRKAWWRWSWLTGLSVVGMVVVLPLADSTQLNVNAWLIAPALWMLLAVPATIGVYGQSFRGVAAQGVGAADGGADYLRALTSVWSVLAVGVGLSLGACLLAGSASPGVWPGALMLMVLVLARPTSGPGVI